MIQESSLSKGVVQQKIILIEVFGFILAIIMCWVTELIDPPFSYHQVITMTGFLSILGFLVIYWTFKLVDRIKYLEGFLVVCASCKRIRVEEEWLDWDHAIRKRTDLTLSHGLCPGCLEKLYVGLPARETGDHPEKGK